MKFRTGLLMGAVFAAGLAAGPVAGLVTGRLALIPAAWAQDSSLADTYRLLTLFSDVFEKVRAEYVEPVPDRDLVENAINGMLTGLDPHSNYMNAKAYADMQVQTSGQFGGLGIEVTEDNGFVKVVSPIDDTPAAKAGVKAGDLILSLNGKSVQGLSLNDAVDAMRGPPNSTITLTIKRDGVDAPLQLSMQREVIKVQVVKARLDGDVGYIRLSQFTEQSDAGIRHAIDQLKQQGGDKLKGFVLDLRNNPGGLLDQAVSVSNDFLNQGEIVSTKARHPEDSQRWDAKAGGDLTGGLPLVVLINGGAASASEIVSGALQDHRRAVLLGTRSFGKGSVQTVIPLPGNGAMRLTTARYYTPSGRSIQGLGITPDVEVHETRAPETHFGPERESDLNHTLTNVGGTPQASLAPRTDLPKVAMQIAKLPPENFPAFDPANPATDYQLQEGELLLRAMATQKHATMQ